MHYLYQWKNIALITAYGPIIDPPIGIELNDDQMIHLKHLKNQSLTDN